MSHPCPISSNCGDFADQISLTIHLLGHDEEDLVVAIMKLLYKENLQ